MEAEEWGGFRGCPGEDKRKRGLGDAAYATSGSLGFSHSLGNLGMEGRCDNRSHKRHLLLQDAVMIPPMKCTKCKELEAQYKKTQKGYFMEIEHVRQGNSKCLDQLMNLMPANQFAVFQQGLQLDVHYLSRLGNEEDSDREGLADKVDPKSPTSPKQTASMAEIDKLKKQISSLEDQNARLEMKILSLQEEMKMPRKREKGEQKEEKAVVQTKEKFVRTTDAQNQTIEKWPEGGVDAKGQPLPGGGGGAKGPGQTSTSKKGRDHDSSDSDSVTGGPRKAGGEKKTDKDDPSGGSGKKDKIKKLEDALDKMTAERDAAISKMRRLERELEETNKLLEKNGAADLLKKMKELQAKYDALVALHGVHPDEHHDEHEVGADGKPRGGPKKPGDTGKTGGGTGGTDWDDHTAGPGKKKGKGPAAGQSGGSKGGSYGGGSFGGEGRERRPSQMIGGQGADVKSGSGRYLIGEGEHVEKPKVETHDAECGPGPGFPQEHVVPEAGFFYKPKPKPEEPMSGKETVCDKKVRKAPNLGLSMGGASNASGAQAANPMSQTMPARSGQPRGSALAQSQQMSGQPRASMSKTMPLTKGGRAGMAASCQPGMLREQMSAGSGSSRDEMQMMETTASPEGLRKTVRLPPAQDDPRRTPEAMLDNLTDDDLLFGNHSQIKKTFDMATFANIHGMPSNPNAEPTSPSDAEAAAFLQAATVTPSAGPASVRPSAGPASPQRPTPSAGPASPQRPTPSAGPTSQNVGTGRSLIPGTPPVPAPVESTGAPSMGAGGQGRPGSCGLHAPLQSQLDEGSRQDHLHNAALPSETTLHRGTDRSPSKEDASKNVPPGSFPQGNLKQGMSMQAKGMSHASTAGAIPATSSRSLSSTGPSSVPLNAGMSSAAVTWHHPGGSQSTPQLAVATEGRACPCGNIFEPEDTHCKKCSAMRPAVQGLRFGAAQAEPYIMHVWESSLKHGQGDSLRRELVDLGAISPLGTFRASSAGSTDQTGGRRKRPMPGSPSGPDPVQQVLKAEAAGDTGAEVSKPP